jgi:hypothetical protein
MQGLLPAKRVFTPIPVYAASVFAHDLLGSPTEVGEEITSEKRDFFAFFNDTFNEAGYAQRKRMYHQCSSSQSNS